MDGEDSFRLKSILYPMNSKNYISIGGLLEVPEGKNHNQVTTEFIQWVESKGYTFAGGIGPYKEEDTGNIIGSNGIVMTDQEIWV
jgi:hypothetical protein